MAHRDHLFVLSTDAVVAQALAGPLRDRGWTVETECGDADTACERIRTHEPMAVVISLEFSEERDCDLTCALSVATAVGDVPIVFVGGTPDVIDAARRVAPRARFVDASHVAWEVKQLSMRQ